MMRAASTERDSSELDNSGGFSRSSASSLARMICHSRCHLPWSAFLRLAHSDEMEDLVVKSVNISVRLSRWQREPGDWDGS